MPERADKPAPAGVLTSGGPKGRSVLTTREGEGSAFPLPRGITPADHAKPSGFHRIHPEITPGCSGFRDEFARGARLSRHYLRGGPGQLRAARFGGYCSVCRRALRERGAARASAGNAERVRGGLHLRQFGLLDRAHRWEAHDLPHPEDAVLALPDQREEPRKGGTLLRGARREDGLRRALRTWSAQHD